MTRTLRLKDLESAAANNSEQPFFTTGIGGRNGARGAAFQGLIFDADFDSMPDWHIEHGRQRYRFTGDVGFPGSSPNGQGNIPQGFDHYYTSQIWHPEGNQYGDDAVPGNQPVAQINSSQSRIEGGKALIIHDESYGSNSQWGSDAVLGKELGAEYTELWFEFYIKFDPTFVWADQVSGNGQTSMKLLRIRRYADRPTDEGRFSYFGELQHLSSPEALFRFKSWSQNDGASNRIRVNCALNGYTSEEDIAAGNLNGDGTPNGFNTPEGSVGQGLDQELSWNDLLLNGQWHKVNYYVKMDSFAGSGDGVIEIWLNDYLELRYDSIPWRRSGDKHIGWDWFAIGGNMNNVWVPEEEQAQQWYAIDGLKVYSGIPSESGEILS